MQNVVEIGGRFVEETVKASRELLAQLTLYDSWVSSGGWRVVRKALENRDLYTEAVRTEDRKVLVARYKNRLAHGDRLHDALHR